MGASSNLIKGWAIVVGVLSLANLVVLTVYPVFSVVGIIAVVALLLGLAVAYAAIQMTTMSVATVAMIFWAKLIWLLVNLVYSVSRGDLDSVRWVILIAQIVIMAYLIWAFRKMHHGNSMMPPMPPSPMKQ